jgi:transcriptional regulator with XRE-family HTH domain
LPDGPPEHQNIEIVPTSLRHNFTTMSPIQEAIEYIELREAGDKFSYRQVAKEFGVDRTTLSRRHQGKTRSYEEMAERQQLLNPQQEHELVLYIERCVRHGLPPTREMIQNFAAAVAKWEVSESWVSRFLHRHADELTIKWSAGIDCNRHKADSKERYKLYFDMLHSKMQEYNIDERNTYNMDEKSFFVGITNRSKRVFTKAIWA